MAKTTVDCPKCRAKFQIDDRWHDADCPACHAHMEIDVSEGGTRKLGSGDATSDVCPGKQFAGRLDCSACKNPDAMVRTSINRMSPEVVLFGWIILVPSALGMLWAIVGFLWTVLKAISRVGLDSHSRMSTDEVAAGITAFIGMGFGGLSLVGILLGSLLIMKKKVYQCRICGFIMDRA